MPVLGVVLLYAGFKLTWLGLASLREGPAGAPAYGRYYLTGHCTVNPVTVTGLSMPLPPHLCEAKENKGAEGGRENCGTTLGRHQQTRKRK